MLLATYFNKLSDVAKRERILCWLKHEEHLLVNITKKGVIFYKVPEDDCDTDCFDNCLYFPVSLQELEAMYTFCHSQQSCFRNQSFVNAEIYFKLKRKIKQAIVKRKVILLEKHNLIVL